jgi:hypothetical protein
MPKIPIQQQRLTVDPIEQIERAIAQGKAVGGEELLRAIERCETHQLDTRLRNVICKFSVSAVKLRGRPSNSKGREDFALRELEARYPVLLRKYEKKAQQSRHLAAAQGDVLANAGPTPSELAYREIQQVMKAEFPNIDWRALRNKHSAWKNGHFHPSENCVGSEDFDAEIDRQFPVSQDT